MSTSPLPPDPYEALGLTKDCDSDTIKKAHRKLVLKHHPDRIKDPELIEYNQNEFTKVQLAYEILIDPISRQRYDNDCKLAQLRRERMFSDPPRPTYTKTTYSVPRQAPPSSNPPPREYKPESRYAYEEREPDSPWLDSSSRSFDDSPRNNSRKSDPKADPYERRTSHSKPTERKEKPRAGQWEKPRAAPAEKSRAAPAEKPVSMRTVFAMAGMAQAAKARVKENQKEAHAKAAKARDEETRRARAYKDASTKQPSPYVEDDDSDDESSESDRETVVAPGRPSTRERSPIRRTLTPEPIKPKRQSSPRADPRSSTQQSPRPEPRSSRRQSPPRRTETRPSRDQSPPPRSIPKPTRQSSSNVEPKPTRQPSPRPEARSTGQGPPRPEPRSSTQASPRPDQRSMYDDDGDSHHDDKYERHFRVAQGYQHDASLKQGRPIPTRQGSDSHYWQTDTGRDRKSDSDSDKQRPSSSHKPSRRSMPDDSSKLRPPMPTQSSAPAGVRATASHLERDGLPKTRSRNNSYMSSPQRRDVMPELKRSGSDPVPHKGPVKRDSVPLKGSSLKQTESAINHDSGYGSSNPHTPEHGGESPHRVSSTKYRVGKEEDGLRARKMAPEDGAPLNRYLSPPDIPHHHRHHHRSESRERRGSSRSREREPEAYRRSGSGRPAPPERQSSFSRNEPSSRYDERERSRNVNIRRDRSPEPGDGYFRHWDGPTQQTKTKTPNFQGAHIPNYSKMYHEPVSSPSSFPRGTPQRRPSVY